MDAVTHWKLCPSKCSEISKILFRVLVIFSQQLIAALVNCSWFIYYLFCLDLLVEGWCLALFEFYADCVSLMVWCQWTLYCWVPVHEPNLLMPFGWWMVSGPLMFDADDCCSNGLMSIDPGLLGACTWALITWDACDLLAILC